MGLFYMRQPIQVKWDRILKPEMIGCLGLNWHDVDTKPCMLRVVVSTRSLLITGLIKGCLVLCMCMKQKHSICFTIEKQSEYER